MAKSADAFRTISEVADDLGIPKHVLRFWEVKFSTIRPMKRGGGRRYYRPEDMELLRGIRHLLHREGYTIKGVQKILREQGVEVVKKRGRGESVGGNPPGSPQQVELPSATVNQPPSSARQSELRTRQPARPQGGPRLVGSIEERRRRAIEEAIAALTACRAILTGTTGTQQPLERRPAAKKDAQ
jgi:DNA-binding transcriptional MerR regulator